MKATLSISSASYMCYSIEMVVTFTPVDYDGTNEVAVVGLFTVRLTPGLESIVDTSCCLLDSLSIHFWCY